MPGQLDSGKTAGGAPAGRASHRRGRHMPGANLGLRARVTLTFGLGALLLSTFMAGLTYFTARQYFLRQREVAVLRQAYVNASLVRSALRSPNPQIPQLLDSLDTLPGSRSVLERRGQWFATSISVGRNAISPAMQAMVTGGRPATQRFVLATVPELVVGVPVPSVSAAYFEVFSLEELARTLRILALALAGAALVTTVAGAITGRWASGRSLKPLGDVSRAAVLIAAGSLDTRMPATADSDLAPLTASFNRMADALQERIEREARFTSDVSHELRSPLTTLSAALGVLEMHRLELSGRTSEALDLLHVEMRRFQRMVDELLEISRVDAGSAELLLDTVDPSELLHHAAMAAGADIPVSVDPAASGKHILVDKRRMERVVANLVGNASQYAGGVEALCIEDGPGSVRLVVADRGPAVAPEDRERIFERFYRGGAAGRRGSTEGTGLGLSLVAEHVRLHGGRVWVEPGPGGGNRFVVEIPEVADDEVGNADRTAGSDGQDGPLRQVAP